MRSKRAIWFEVKVAYDKIMEDGLQKRVKETYVVDAMSFSDGECKTIKEMASFVRGDYRVADMKKASYGEVFFSDIPDADPWYKVKVQYIVIDEKTEKEKRVPVYFLVQACNLRGAVNAVESNLRTMADYNIISVAETAIMDVLEYVKEENKA